MKTESYTSAAGYEKSAPDMRAQFEAEFMEKYGEMAGNKFLTRDRTVADDYYFEAAHFAFLGYQLAKGVK